MRRTSGDTSCSLLSSKTNVQEAKVTSRKQDYILKSEPVSENILILSWEDLALFFPPDWKVGWSSKVTWWVSLKALGWVSNSIKSRMWAGHGLLGSELGGSSDPTWPLPGWARCPRLELSWPFAPVHWLWMTHDAWLGPAIASHPRSYRSRACTRQSAAADVCLVPFNASPLGCVCQHSLSFPKAICSVWKQS